jgi:hypothetical protein
VSGTWRAGQTSAKNLYKDNRDVGRMDSSDLALEVVTGMNSYPADHKLLDALADGTFENMLLERMSESEAQRRAEGDDGTTTMWASVATAHTRNLILDIIKGARS